ncbi:MAG: hypothetical protein ACLFQV_08780 [Vulcanimicrobiota bacterium]
MKLKSRKINYDQAFQQLDEIAAELQQDIKTVEQEETTENLDEITKDITQKLLDGQHAYMETVDCLIEFINNEDPELLKHARQAMFDAEMILRRGDDLNQDLAELFEAQGFQV